ncbi:hypothetical protein BO70DRAFT_374985 [Aspergillus heteromorphus CBS 117.55]|uniref:Histone chaperone domain-containing protein n=1 Tax=Aspergillus heteromorphus CBS 117.55 TaxID=1448321 RepID=A0A317UV45_9EURO|nr:uncharacterized protein BO70DRAFT_374985 [Aspergillus heteromorphus CBS 117.55]PWY65321.1 hypothetical protein BO70DRAFT_374985 [Aspergillus heteromorphus CBS 117.55]
MGDNNRSTAAGFDPASNAPDAAAWDKGKGKATDPARDVSMDDDESEESEGEEMDDGDNLEPISADNIISGGRRTRGKTIDYQEAAEKLKGEEMDDEDDEDDDYVGADEDDDDKMRD